jgi:GH24 family phage-related lysozyme (muramidase)
MNTSQNGIRFIMAQEGLTLVVKGDTGGKQEIGYGHDLLPGESFPDGITQLAALGLLISDVAKVDPAVNALSWTLTQNQFDALADFTYECGPGALDQLASHGQSQIMNQLPRWVHANVNGVEVVLQAMVNRRRAEISLWNS